MEEPGVPAPAPPGPCGHTDLLPHSPSGSLRRAEVMGTHPGNSLAVKQGLRLSFSFQMRLYKVVPGSSEGPGPVPPSCQPRTKPQHGQDRKFGSSSAGTHISLPLTQPLLLLCLPELLGEPSQGGGTKTNGHNSAQTQHQPLLPPQGDSGPTPDPGPIHSSAAGGTGSVVPAA